MASAVRSGPYSRSEKEALRPPGTYRPDMAKTAFESSYIAVMGTNC